ncbi:hypothetical protein LNV09_24655, partial [Paucibacter sp. B2R-40]|uniref:hypothetical protein n=1 Tax=Paucibacter sp. B2R-40 TaxID=2893554 RepID=UPI0021E4FC18
AASWLRPLSFDVRAHMSATWPCASYFNSGTATARNVMRELEFVDRKNWYELYRRTEDETHWRLDAEDKFQQRYLVRIEDPANWEDFDSTELEKRLLLESRGGLGPEGCICLGCSAPVLLGSAFCLDHTYERGVRK